MREAEHAGEQMRDERVTSATYVTPCIARSRCSNRYVARGESQWSHSVTIQAWPYSGSMQRTSASSPSWWPHVLHANGSRMDSGEAT